MEITDGKILYCYDISEGSEDKKVLMVDYNNRTFYDCFNNPFPDHGVSPTFNLPLIARHYRPCLDKRYQYTPDMIPASISVTSENSISSLDTPSDYPQVLVLDSDDPNPHHSINKYNPVCQ